MKRRRESCEVCSTPPAFPVTGAELSRRGFLRLGALGLTASFIGSVPQLLGETVRVKPRLRNTARNCILIFLEGAPSQTDLWDLKEGPWTPPHLQPTSFGDVRWPRGILPKLADHLDKLTIVRTGRAWVEVHPLAQRWAQIGRNPAGVLGNVAPHIGSVVALETQPSRRISDILPAFVAFQQPRASSGYFSSTVAPLTLRPASAGTLSSLEHADGNERLARRLDLLQRLDPDRDGALGKAAHDFGALYTGAQNLTESPDIAPLFDVSAADFARYGSTPFGSSLVLAKQLIAADRGTRFVQATSLSWDDHNNLYAQLSQRCTGLDAAVSSLLDDLSATPGSVEGKTLLDETMVVLYAEFGRTLGPLNAQKGRDHHQRMSIVFAGGGVQGGRVVGATDALGDKAVDYGWRAGRDVRSEDVTATIYSAMGIDYTTVRYDDPLARGYEYVPLAREGLYEPVEELF
jgi:Protein of unknown function (DUF1501)